MRKTLQLLALVGSLATVLASKPFVEDDEQADFLLNRERVSGIEPVFKEATRFLKT